MNPNQVLIYFSFIILQLMNSLYHFPIMRTLFLYCKASHNGLIALVSGKDHFYD